MLIELTDKECEDVRRGLILAMQILDKGNFADKQLADRIEVLEPKFIPNHNNYQR